MKDQAQAEGDEPDRAGQDPPGRPGPSPRRTPPLAASPSPGFGPEPRLSAAIRNSAGMPFARRSDSGSRANASASEPSSR